MVTHNFNKLLPFLFNMDTLVSDQSSPMTYTNRFCVAMLAVFATYNPSEAALTVLSRVYGSSIIYGIGNNHTQVQVRFGK